MPHEIDSLPMENKKMVAWDYLLIALVFLVIYPLNFVFLPTYLDRIIAITGIAYFSFGFLVKNRTIKVDSWSIVLSLLLLCYTLWVEFRIIATNFDDTSLLSNVVLMYAQLSASFFVAYLLNKRTGSMQDVIKIMHIAIVIQGVFIITSFLSIDFKLLVLKYLKPVESNLDPMHPFRVGGLTHGASSKLAAVQGVGLLYSTYLFLCCKSKEYFFYTLLSIPVLLGSVLLTGRTGFLVIIPIAGFVIFYLVITRNFPRKLLFAVAVTPLVLVGGFWLFQKVYLLTGGWGSTLMGEDAFDGLIRWATEEFIVFLNGKSTDTRIGAELQNMWFFPDTPSELFLGDPTTWSLYRIRSDIGYVRMAFGVGIIGATLLYFFTLAVHLVTICRVKDTASRLLIVFSFVWIVIVEFKECFFNYLPFVTIYSLLYFFHTISRNNRSRLGVEPVSSVPFG